MAIKLFWVKLLLPAAAGDEIKFTFLTKALSTIRYAIINLEIFFERNGPTRPLFVYFRSFQPQILQKNL